MSNVEGMSRGFRIMQRVRGLPFGAEDARAIDPKSRVGVDKSELNGKPLDAGKQFDGGWVFDMPPGDLAKFL